MCPEGKRPIGEYCWQEPPSSPVYLGSQNGLQPPLPWRLCWEDLEQDVWRECDPHHVPRADMKQS